MALFVFAYTPTPLSLQSRPRLGGPDLFDRARVDINADHKLTEEDRQFLLASAASKTIPFAQAAILDLVRAAQLGLFPKSAVLALIEKRANGAERLESSFYASDYYLAIKIFTPAVSRRDPPNAPADKKLRMDLQRLRSDAKISTTFDSEERQFITRAIANRDPEGKVFGVSVILGKKNLDQESFGWATTKIRDQIKMKTPPLRPYWAFVLRVVEARTSSKKR